MEILKVHASSVRAYTCIVHLKSALSLASNLVLHIYVILRYFMHAILKLVEYVFLATPGVRELPLLIMRARAASATLWDSFTF